MSRFKLAFPATSRVSLAPDISRRPSKVEGARGNSAMPGGSSGRLPKPAINSPLREVSKASVPADGSSAHPKSAERQELDLRIVSLVRRFREGDDAAFDELAPLAGRMAYHLALRSVADANVAEEISQEALVRLYKHVGEIAGEGAFKTWFYRIVLNLVHDFYRRSVRQENATTTLEEIRSVERKSRDEPLSNIERDALRSALTEALECLDEKHREAFLMKEVEGLSHAEIAKTLDVPEGTVWSRLSYARRKLQEKLRRMGYSN
jgi:RNA polymerase sigma-70 factor, ECF subfamily